MVTNTWLKNRAKCASSTAWSTSASSMITKGDLPPNSSVTGLRLLLAANSSTIFPVSVDPVNASFVEGKKYMITHSVRIVVLAILYKKNTRIAYLINIHVTSKSSTSSRTKTRDNIHDTLRESSLFKMQGMISSGWNENCTGYKKYYSLYIFTRQLANCMLKTWLDL